MKAKVALLGCGNPARKWHLPTLSELSRRGEIEGVAGLTWMGELTARIRRLGFVMPEIAMA